MGKFPLPSETTIVEKLVQLYLDDQWLTKRCHVLGLTGRDVNAFFPLMTLLILDQCQTGNSRLDEVKAQALENIKQFRREHLTWFWEFKQDTATLFGSSRFRRWVPMSADADCTCLDQIVNPQPELVPKLLDHLTFCRLDTGKFKLIEPQRKILPQASGSYMTWLPDPQIVKIPQHETIDICVDAIILWFLNSVNQNHLEGANETYATIRTALSRSAIINDPFAVSPYYPNPAIILYLLTRAIVWGKLTRLDDMLDRIRTLAKRIRPKSTVDHLCLASVGIFLDDPELVKPLYSINFTSGMRVEPFFIGHYGLGKSSALFQLARTKLWQFQCANEAYQWAMLLWIVQNSPFDNSIEG